MIGRFWDKMEEIFIVFLLCTMTLVTFSYVVFNNLYELLFYCARIFPFFAVFFKDSAYFVIGIVQSMGWSIALTKACFAWLIFFGASYVVKMQGHIGVDNLVKLLPGNWQRIISIIAIFLCVLYSVLISLASYEWIEILFVAGVGAEDLESFGVRLWHVGLIMPLGFLLIGVRFIGILIKILRGEQKNLKLADESKAEGLAAK